MPPYRTRALVSCGYVAANSSDIGTPSDEPKITARSEPAAAITARTSSIRSSRIGAPTTGSDSPLPRLSNMMSRANDAIRSMMWTAVGISQISSTCEM